MQKRPLQRILALSQMVWRRIENIVFGIVLTLIVLYLVLQMPAVQNWLVRKVVAYLSSELNTTVQVRNINISFFDNLVLEGFYVQDLKGDTLLYAGELVAGLNTNVFTLFSNKLEFNEISLTKARFNIRRKTGEYHNNLQFILDYFDSEPKTPPKKPTPFRIRIQNLHLSDVEFLQDDEVRGQRMHFKLPSATIRVNNLDLPSKIVDVRSADIKGLSFALEESPSRPLPERVVPVAQAIASAIDTIENAQPKRPLRFSIGRFSLTDGRFSLDKYDAVPDYVLRPDVMDYEHLRVRDISLQADSIVFDDDLVFRGILKNLSAKEKSGFHLSHVEAERVVVCDTLVGLYNATLQTPGTSLGDTIALHYSTYRDFIRFPDKVRLDIQLDKGSKLRIGDISYFSEAVANNPFFIQNAEEVAEISGFIYDKVNNLKGRELDIKLDARTYMKGKFDGNNLTGSDPGPQIISLKFETLRSDFTTITRIIPGFSAPDYFYRLGQIGFSGHYDNFYGHDHILEGKLLTDLGEGVVDLKLDLSAGRDNAVYSGHINMANFDLATWTDNPDFGPTSFDIRIKEPSRGLTLKTLDASVVGKVDSVRFRNYNYQNISLNGNFKEYVFKGDLGVNDDNIRFDLKGNINLRDSVPLFDFSAKLSRLDLGALNLLDEDWVLSADIERIYLKARRIEDVVGEIELSDFMILQDREQTHRMDDLRFASGYRPDGTRFFSIRSDILDGDMNGYFDMPTLPNTLGQLFARQHPAFAERIGLLPDSTVLTDNFTMWLQVKDTKGFTRLFSDDLDTLRGVRATASVEARKGLTNMLLTAPSIKYGGARVQDLYFKWTGEPDTSFYNLRIPTITLSGKYELPPLRLDGFMTDEDLAFNFDAKDSSAIVESIHLNGLLNIADSLWQVKFNASEIALFNTSWYMDDNNYIRFGKDVFEPYNFDLMSGNLRLSVEKHNEGRGLRLSLANFDVKFVNDFINDTTLNIKGRIAGFDVTIKELYQLQDIEANIDIDELFIKEKSYSSFYGFVRMPHIKAPLQWRFVTQKGIEQPTLRFLGTWLPPGNEPQTIEFLQQRIDIAPGEVRARVVADSFQLAILETIVPGISKTAGRFNADATLFGTFDQIGVRGNAQILNGQFQMDYLGSLFHIKNQQVSLTEYKIWADSVEIWDATEKNLAIVNGGLIHNHFHDWSVSCEVASVNNNFLVLNTLPDDNALYYGQGIGKFKAVFSGTFVRTNIVVDATTGKDTRLYIPITSASDAQGANFINYKPKRQAEDVEKETKSVKSNDDGLNIEMNLTITEDAEVQLIFDEKSGDIIKGRGEGDITLVMTRAGEFKMYGSYQIRRGEYLFTLLNWVNKPFNVLNGGTINWYGDPYGAQINLDATYEENTSLYNLLRDVIELIPNAANEASKATRVVVTMHLKGDLMKPTISFDLDFPNISSQLRSLVENKVRLLRQDQNELNRQVFGLVVVGSFLPSNAGGFIQNSDYLASAFNTLTQVLSNQLSNYLSELAIEWFGGAVSSIEFDIAYNEYQNALTDPGQTTQVGRELQLRLTSGFANDRVTVQFGSQFGLGQPGTAVQEGFLGEDVTVEIQLTENRQWRLKVYQRTEPDIAGGQRRARYGFGISFRKDYDSFSDMIAGATNWFKKKG